MEIRVQAGGLIGIQALLTAELPERIDNIHALVTKIRISIHKHI